MRIILANPRGFCAGVTRAIEVVEKAIQKYGAPIYVRHEIVHNKHVVEDLRKKGAIFINEINDIPEGNVVIFSAHGVSERVEKEAASRQLNIIDATCPLVTKVHNEAKKSEAEGRDIILIGHKDHPEVEGTSGRVKQEVILISNLEDIENIKVKNPNNLSYVTQTTLSVDDTVKIIDKLKEKFPNIIGPNLKDICYATQNRQNAVKAMIKDGIDILIVIGGRNSSNSNRLRDLGLEKNIKSYLIDDLSNIKEEWFLNTQKIGITAGASAPEFLVRQLVDFLENKFNTKIEELNGIREEVIFKLPKHL